MKKSEIVETYRGVKQILEDVGEEDYDTWIDDAPETRISKRDYMETVTFLTAELAKELAEQSGNPVVDEDGRLNLDSEWGPLYGRVEDIMEDLSEDTASWGKSEYVMFHRVYAQVIDELEVEAGEVGYDPGGKHPAALHVHRSKDGHREAFKDLVGGLSEMLEPEKPRP